MPYIFALEEKEKRILRENGMDPKCYGVMTRDEDMIRLLCYKTRDIITVHKGDRKWPE